MMKTGILILALLTLGAASVIAKAAPDVASHSSDHAIVNPTTLDLQRDEAIKRRLLREGLNVEGAVEISPQYVPPDVMGWWVDPRHNERPANIYWRDERFQLVSNPRHKYEGSALGPYSDLASDPHYGDETSLNGIGFAIPTTDNKGMLVKGTRGNLDRLLALIKSLDKPLRSVRFDVQIATVSLDKLDSLIIPLPASTQPYFSRLTIPHIERRVPRADFFPNLQNLVKSGKAQLLLHDSRTSWSGEIAQFAQVDVPSHPAGKNTVKFSLSVSALIETDNTLTLTIFSNPCGEVGTPLKDETPCAEVLFSWEQNLATVAFVTPHIVPQTDIPLTH